MPPDVLDYAPARDFDTGLFVARYFQALALASVLWMVIEPILFHRFTLDLTFLLLLLLGSALKRHSAAARKFFLIVAGICLGLSGYLVLHAVAFGTDRITVSLGRRIDHPAVWQVCASATLFTVVLGVPFFVLLTPRAKRQFRVGGATSLRK